MMAFSSHRHAYDLCLFFSLFMYLITSGRGITDAITSGRGITDAYDEQTIFPTLSPTTAATTMTGSLRSGVASIQGIQDNLSSKDLTLTLSLADTDPPAANLILKVTKSGN